MLETLSKFGKEYKVSLEFKADSAGSNDENIIEIGNRHVAIWLKANSKVRVESKVSGSALATTMGGFSAGTFHKVEVTQSLLVDKVDI